MGSRMNWLIVLTTKHISSQVLTKYIKQPISCLCRVWSINSESEAWRFFQLVIICVDMGLQASMWNLLRISTMYFPCLGKKCLSSCHTSNPKNNASSWYPSSQTLKQDLSCNPQWVSLHEWWSSHQHTTPEWKAPYPPQWSIGFDQPHSLWNPTTVCINPQVPNSRSLL